MEIIAITNIQTEIMLWFENNNLQTVYVYANDWNLNNVLTRECNNNLFIHIDKQSWKEFFNLVDTLYFHKQEINLRKKLDLCDYIDLSKIVYID